MHLDIEMALLKAVGFYRKVSVKARGATSVGSGLWATKAEMIQ